MERVGHLRENRVTAIILAGGKSSRFGKDKATFRVASHSLTFYQYKKLKKIFKSVYISTKKDKFEFKAKKLFDRNRSYLPIFSLVNAIKKFNNIFVIPVDVPLLSENSIQKLLKKRAISNNSPFIGVYNRKELKKLQQNIKSGNYSPRIGKKSITIKEEELLNLNYYQDYKKNRVKIEKAVIKFLKKNS